MSTIESRMTVNGEAIKGPASFPVENPATGEFLAEAPACDLETLNQAMASAEEAFHKWSRQKDRGDVLLECAKRLKGQAMQLARLLTSEQGKPLRESINEMMGASQVLRHFAEMPLPSQNDSIATENGFKILQHPLGVVAAITPWNYPIMLAMSKIAPALLAGNSVVVKPSPYTPLTTLAIGELFREILPPGVLNIVSGDDDLGKAMTQHLSVRMITLTGSVDTGKAVARTASDDLKRIVLELGGNDPAIVLPDVDPTKVAEDLFWGAFRNCGQICHAIKRLYVHESIATQLIAEMKQIAEGVAVGDGMERDTKLGPLNNQPQLARVEELVESAKHDGANIVTGGKRLQKPGFFYEPTLVDDVDDSMALVCEEQFGPALPILRFKDVDQAIAKANDSHFGLSGSVWSNDHERAADIVRQLECGTGWINQHGTTHPSAPVGGQKWSGIGYENGLAGLKEYTRFQTVFAAR